MQNKIQALSTYLNKLSNIYYALNKNKILKFANEIDKDDFLNRLENILSFQMQALRLSIVVFDNCQVEINSVKSKFKTSNISDEELKKFLIENPNQKTIDAKLTLQVLELNSITKKLNNILSINIDTISQLQESALDNDKTINIPINQIENIYANIESLSNQLVELYNSLFFEKRNVENLLRSLASYANEHINLYKYLTRLFEEGLHENISFNADEITSEMMEAFKSGNYEALEGVVEGAINKNSEEEESDYEEYEKLAAMAEEDPSKLTAAQLAKIKDRQIKQTIKEFVGSDKANQSEINIGKALEAGLRPSGGREALSLPQLILNYRDGIKATDKVETTQRIVRKKVSKKSKEYKKDESMAEKIGRAKSILASAEAKQDSYLIYAASEYLKSLEEQLKFINGTLLPTALKKEDADNNFLQWFDAPESIDTASGRNELFELGSKLNDTGAIDFQLDEFRKIVNKSERDLKIVQALEEIKNKLKERSSKGETTNFSALRKTFASLCNKVRFTRLPALLNDSTELKNEEFIESVFNSVDTNLYNNFNAVRDFYRAIVKGTFKQLEGDKKYYGSTRRDFTSDFITLFNSINSLSIEDPKDKTLSKINGEISPQINRLLLMIPKIKEETKDKNAIYSQYEKQSRQKRDQMLSEIENKYFKGKRIGDIPNIGSIIDQSESDTKEKDKLFIVYYLLSNLLKSATAHLKLKASAVTVELEKSGLVREIQNTISEELRDTIKILYLKHIYESKRKTTKAREKTSLDSKIKEFRTVNKLSPLEPVDLCTGYTVTPAPETESESRNIPLSIPCINENVGTLFDVSGQRKYVCPECRTKFQENASKDEMEAAKRLLVTQRGSKVEKLEEKAVEEAGYVKQEFKKDISEQLIRNANFIDTLNELVKLEVINPLINKNLNIRNNLFQFIAFKELQALLRIINKNKVKILENWKINQSTLSKLADDTGSNATKNNILQISNIVDPTISAEVIGKMPRSTPIKPSEPKQTLQPITAPIITTKQPETITKPVEKIEDILNNIKLTGKEYFFNEDPGAEENFNTEMKKFISQLTSGQYAETDVAKAMSYIKNLASAIGFSDPTK